MPPHRYGRRDANEAEIIRMLREVGASVEPLSKTGAPDILIGYKNSNFLAEIKTDKGKLTPDEIEWHERWRGQVAVIRNTDDALRLIGFDI